jgi:hypothetical protein
MSYLLIQSLRRCFLSGSGVRMARNLCSPARPPAATSLPLRRSRIIFVQQDGVLLSVHTAELKSASDAWIRTATRRLCTKSVGPLPRRTSSTTLAGTRSANTYRSWLDDTGAPMGVQQKLMLHADISTMAKYGGALMESKSKHNTIVVRRGLGNA